MIKEIFKHNKSRKQKKGKCQLGMSLVSFNTPTFEKGAEDREFRQFKTKETIGKTTEALQRSNSS